jgi:hypothetical protein
LVHLVNQTNEIDQTNQTTVFSNSFLDFAATETAGADANAFGLTVDQCPDWLEVGLEDPLGLVIGVTDVMAGLATFATEIACVCHRCTPSSSRMLKKSSSGVFASLRGSTYRSVRLASSLAAALLDGLFEHPAWCYSNCPKRAEQCNFGVSTKLFRSLQSNRYRILNGE